MNVLLLSKYGRLGASSRLRTMQYLPALEASGIKVNIEPLFTDGYLLRLYEGQNTWVQSGTAVFRRMIKMRTIASVDLVWLEKEALPWIPWFIERALMQASVPIVSDYDDAIFHRYDSHKLAAVRGLLGSKIDRVMAASAAVVAGNDYLAARAVAAGATRVEVVPTVVDTAAYQRRLRRRNDKPVVGWIGTPSTWQTYVRPHLEMLVQIASANGATFRAVGAGPLERQDAIELLDWSESDEVDLIRGMDIGIMPLADTPWSRGKCGYKLIQYMACGLPVVASPVGVNSEIVEHGVSGFLAADQRQWRDALATLLHNPELRDRMGQAGRKKVEEEYSLERHGPRLAGMLRDVAIAGKRHC